MNLNDIVADHISVQGVTGKVTLKVNDSLNRYDLNIRTENGFLTVNDERVRVIIDEQETVVNYLEENREETDRSITVNSFRSNISITSNEETASNTDEPVNENESVQE